MTPIALALALSGQAQATELVYAPVDHSAYRLQVALSTPYGTTWLAQENVNARSWKVGASLVIDCDHEGANTRCEVLRASFIGAAPETGQADLDRILEEYARLLVGSSIQVEWMGQGRVRSIDLEGVPKGTQREALVQEYLRMLVSRAFSPLELELPKGGDDKGKAWKQKGQPLALRLVDVTGTSGGVKLLHEVIGEEDGKIVINTAGEGIVQSGFSIEQGANQTVSMMMSGQAQFDPALGLLVYNKEIVQGVYTAQAGKVGQGLAIDHLAEAMLLTDLEGFLAEWDAEILGIEASSPPEEPPGEVLEIDVSAQPRDLGELLGAEEPAEEPEAAPVEDLEDAAAPE